MGLPVSSESPCFQYTSCGTFLRSPATPPFPAPLLNQFRLKRIHLSFSKKGTKTLAALESQNRKLRELLDSNDKLDSLKSVRKDTAWGAIFECIRKHASSLHTAVSRGWQCDCANPHLAGLRLQQRTVGGWSSSFNLAFGVSTLFRLS